MDPPARPVRRHERRDRRPARRLQAFRRCSSSARCAAAPATATAASSPTGAAAATSRRGRCGWRDDDARQHPRARVGAVTRDAPHDCSFGVRCVRTLCRQTRRDGGNKDHTPQNGKLHDSSTVVMSASVKATLPVQKGASLYGNRAEA